MVSTIVFADDSESLVNYLRDEVQGPDSGAVHFFTSLSQVSEFINGNRVDRLILDNIFDGESLCGLDVLEVAKKRYPEAECILVTGHRFSQASLARLAGIGGRLIYKNRLNWRTVRGLFTGMPLPQMQELASSESPDVAELILRLEERSEGDEIQDRSEGGQPLRRRKRVKPAKILHLSDIHIESDADASTWSVQLATDLQVELGVDELDYLVVSGDIANTASASEYAAATDLIQCIVDQFKVGSDRVIPTPGNHDVDWRASRRSYKYTYYADSTDTFSVGATIPAGSEGVLVRNEELYLDRFKNFSDNFYQRFVGNAYPTSPVNQGILHAFPDEELLFLTLNSSWIIDHYYRNRGEINASAIAAALDRLLKNPWDHWLKVAVWHHPIVGPEAIRSDFLGLLEVHGFQLCLTGHIHEAINGYHQYDPNRGMWMIGAGTFGAPAKEQVTGIPLQYNILTLNRESNAITVETRKREKANGAWCADARWGDKKHPKPEYTIDLNDSEQ